jgi:hypothetical protein
MNAADSMNSQRTPAEMSEATAAERIAQSEFDYRPVPPLAPIALFLGICSFAGLLGLPALVIGLVGAPLGLLALWQISRSDGEFGGGLVALSGLILSIVSVLSGSALHAYNYVHEVPEGYERVSFNWLSQQVPAATREGMQLHPDVELLDGKPIFVKGYMYPTQKTFGLKEFVLLKDTGQCCFGGNPKLTDMIVVKFKDGMTVDHREQQLVSVAGIFRADRTVRSGELTAIYSIEGDYFK